MKKRILIVDDISINRKILNKQLSDTYRIAQASNGLEALEWLEQNANNTAGILLDLGMPVMDGFEFLAERQKRPALQNIPVLVMTGHGKGDAEERALELGADDFLGKPYIPSILKRRLGNLIRLTDVISNEALVESIINHVPSGIFIMVIGSKVRLRYISETVVTLTGYDHDSFLARFGENAMEMVHSSDIPLAKQTLLSAIPNQLPLDFQFKMILYDGRLEWRHITANYVTTDNEGLVYYGIMQDISKQKEAEIQLEAQRRALDNAYESLQMTLAFSNLRLSEYDIKKRQLILHTSAKDSTAGDKHIVPIDSYLDSGNFLPETLDLLKRSFTHLDHGAHDIDINIQIDINGQRRWQNMVFHTIYNSDGKPDRALGIVRDVTDEVRLEQEYDKEKQLRLAQAEGSLLILECDVTSDKIIGGDGINTYGIQLGMSMTHLFQLDLLNMVHPDDRHVFSFIKDLPTMIDQIASGRQQRTLQCRIISPLAPYSGYSWRSFTFDYITNPADKHIHAIVCIRDINEHKLVEIATQERAQRDSLTKLLNRATFEEMVNVRLAKKNPEHLASFLLIDVDYFKQINDSLGHAKGDEVLCFISDQLRSTFRPTDIIGRLGGDEIAVFMSEVPNEHIPLNRGQVLQDKLSTWECNETHPVTCSIGISLAPQHGLNFDSLYQCADLALYQSKEHGRNCCTLYND